MGERGQTATELLGLLVVVAVLIGVLAGGGIGERIACELSGAVERISGGDGSRSCGDDGGVPTSGPTASPTPVTTPPATPTPALTPAPTPIPGEPTRELPAGWEPNGCGPPSLEAVPDAPLGFDFLAACNGHDRCYAEQRGKAYCDSAFGDAMHAVCAKEAWWKASTCHGLANVYEGAVSTWGDTAYENAGKD